MTLKLPVMWESDTSPQAVTGIASEAEVMMCMPFKMNDTYATGRTLSFSNLNNKSMIDTKFQ